MAIIPQTQLFTWDQLETSPDLDRLRFLLSALPDEPLMQTLENERRGRRDDYPIRPIWNSLLAGIVFQHSSIEALRRELLRNGELRQVCGFDTLKGDLAVPPAYVYTRFFKKLLRHQTLVDEMFSALVERLGEVLPDFGRRLAIDSKAVPTYAKGRKDPDTSADPDADWGKKTYRGVRADGTVWETVKKWFGYKIHLIVDSDHELPVAYEVTRASVHDNPRLLPLMENLAQEQPAVVARTELMSGDKGYDCEANNRTLWDRYAIKPILDIRATWKEEPDKPRPLNPDEVETLFYTEDGKVLCRHRDTEDEAKNYAEMAFEGFEKERGCLKYRCPAAAYGIACTEKEFCNSGRHTAHGRIVRVPLSTDRRTFVPLARSSYTWEREYHKRSAVERVNSRLATSFGFERHFIRGKKKMTLRVGLALVVMLGMAVGSLEAGQQEKMRSLVQARAA